MLNCSGFCYSVLVHALLKPFRYHSIFVQHSELSTIRQWSQVSRIFFDHIHLGRSFCRLNNSKKCIEMLQQIESFGLNYHEIIYFLSHSQQLFMLWIIFTYVLFSQVDCLQDVWPALFLTFLLFSDLFFLFYISKKVLTKLLSGMKYLAKICTSRCCYLYGWNWIIGIFNI